MVFTYSPPGTAGDIYVSAGNGTGAPEASVKSENIKHVNQCSDGRFLIYDDHNGAQLADIWILPGEPPASGLRKPIPFLTTSADETFGQFSPDGTRITYISSINPAAAKCMYGILRLTACPQSAPVSGSSPLPAGTSLDGATTGVSSSFCRSTGGR